MLGKVLHSYPFQVIGAVLSCIHISIWLFVSSMTIYRGVIRGELFHAPCLAPPAAATAEQQSVGAVGSGDAHMHGDGLQSMPEVGSSPLPAVLQELEAKLSLAPPSSVVPEHLDIQHLREQLSVASALLQGIHGHMPRHCEGLGVVGPKPYVRGHQHLQHAGHGLGDSRAGSGVMDQPGAPLMGPLREVDGSGDQSPFQRQWPCGHPSKGV